MSITAAANHSLFFSPDNTSKDFGAVLRDVQEYISSKYSTLILDGGKDEVKEQVKRYISKYLMDYRIAVKDMTTEQLIDALYTEMAEFSFLTKYIFGTGIEEIDVNAWNDIEVQYSNGQTVKLDEQFDSPEHAINVVRRMLHVSGMVLDNSSPAILGHLSKNIRIAVLKTPLVDEDVGVAASIRIVNPQHLGKADFVRGGTATEEMLDFLSECLRYGISVCVAGATSSGKTTLAGWLLTTIPDSKRIFTIENGSRELALVRKKDDKIVNSVIHTLTRSSENEKQNIDQDSLLDMALRFNPEIVCVGEMRSSEAYTAQEAARTGHTVLTTIHSNSCEATWRRMITLCKRKYDIADDTLMSLVTEAFPIVVFTKQLENKQRKMMEVMECEILSDGQKNFRSLYRFNITENRMDGDRFIINGSHQQENTVSKSLQKRFLENGMPQEVLNKILKGGSER
ncbi:Type II/IV secretion system ATP hydrolase TadA/VirB11/CpaF, TadA subfamily [Desulfosporosinus sp. I2]|uniref:type II/IV secretion system ATPase subunit n=1 Tax=Desulfosporosinus sp. I2 TaxID=1617025 RepID=UPI0005F0A966|nr:ATPase, T2SS/T4P/T4SS family [Desulfosporosinus sp. I2]KJR47130.1 Type II/IV secretion system ATP hydrolase TadA/VirB11/CpaF, TadA subfamily [Desulfosporosinus sp. I2]